MSMPVNNRFSILLGEKRSIPLTEIAEETGILILYPTLLAWASNRVVRYDVPVIDALAKYFQIEDLLDLDNSTEDNSQTTQKESRPEVRRLFATRKAPGMQKWEYKILPQVWNDEEHVYYWHEGEERYERDILLRLNDAGQEGWELVTIEAGPEQSINYFFKRPLE